MKTLGEIIQKYRKTNHLSVRDFAKRSGLSKSYISALEHGVSGGAAGPSYSVVAKAAEAMKVNPAKLYKKLGVEIGEICELKDTNTERVMPVKIEPFEYIEPTFDNLKDALKDYRFLVLPFPVPREGKYVYIPVFAADGQVIMNTVTKCDGGVYWAESEAFGEVMFNLFDLGKTVFTVRTDAHEALRKWRDEHRSDGYTVDKNIVEGLYGGGRLDMYKAKDESFDDDDDE